MKDNQQQEREAFDAELLRHANEALAQHEQPPIKSIVSTDSTTILWAARRALSARSLPTPSASLDGEGKYSVKEAYRRFPDVIEPMEEDDRGKILKDLSPVRYGFLEGVRYAFDSMEEAKAALSAIPAPKGVDEIPDETPDPVGDAFADGYAQGYRACALNKPPQSALPPEEELMALIERYCVGNSPNEHDHKMCRDLARSILSLLRQRK